MTSSRWSRPGPVSAGCWRAASPRSSTSNALSARFYPSVICPPLQSVGLPATVRGVMAPPGPIRVAHFTDTWVPRRDGVVTAVQTLTTAMDEIGHESLVVVPRHHDQDATDTLLRLPSLPCGIAQFRIGTWPRGRHVERVARWQPNVIHVHTPGPIGLLGIFAARALTLPLVLTYHTDLCAYADAYRLPPHILAGLLRCYARRLGMPSPRKDHSWSPKVYRRTVVEAATKLLYGTADTVIVPTDAVLRRAGTSLTFPRLRIVPTGVTLPATGPDARANFRARYRIGPDEPTVLYVGRLNREKGIDLLTPAFGEILAQLPTARLVLVGSTHDDRWVDRLIARSGIAERTVRTGQLPPSAVAEAYAAADVFAFPSRTDTQGLVVQEAALAGLPVVLADEALHRSGPLAGATLFGGHQPAEYAAALTQPLTDHRLAWLAGEAGRARARRNTPQAYAKRLAGVYGESLIRRRHAERMLIA
ncbi:MAG: glycosyltransferase [Streptosporangiales bacterium]|nr:glycosyltransferase [Streptosporangiales bacterium]